MKSSDERVREFKRLFRERYPHLVLQVHSSDEDRFIRKFLDREHVVDASIETQLNLFSDYVLSQGHCEVME